MATLSGGNPISHGCSVSTPPHGPVFHDMYIVVCVFIYIYININININTHTVTHTYIYIYIYKCRFTSILYNYIYFLCIHSFDFICCQFPHICHPYLRHPQKGPRHQTRSRHIRSHSRPWGIPQAWWDRLQASRDSHSQGNPHSRLQGCWHRSRTACSPAAPWRWKAIERVKLLQGARQVIFVGL